MKKVSSTLSFAEKAFSCILSKPKGSKVAVPPDGTAKLYRGRLGESIILPSPEYNTNMRMQNISYNCLHDPLLKTFFKQPERRKQLLEHGLITEDEQVLCSVQEFNSYIDNVKTVQCCWEKLHREHQALNPALETPMRSAAALHVPSQSAAALHVQTQPAAALELSTLTSAALDVPTESFTEQKLPTLSEALKVTSPPSAALEVTSPPSAALEVTSPPSAALEVTSPPSAALEVTSPPSAALEVTSPPSAALEVTSLPSAALEVMSLSSESSVPQKVPISSEALEGLTVSSPEEFTCVSPQLSILESDEEVEEMAFHFPSVATSPVTLKLPSDPLCHTISNNIVNAILHKVILVKESEIQVLADNLQNSRQMPDMYNKNNNASAHSEKRKRGIRAFLRRVWLALKQSILHNRVSPLL